jgi:hypothetical protein
MAENSYKVIDLGYAEVSFDSFRNLVQEPGLWVASVISRRVDILHHCDAISVP